MEMGIFDEYTMLNYMVINGINSNVLHRNRNLPVNNFLIKNNKNSISLLFKGEYPESVELFDLSGKSVYKSLVKNSSIVIERLPVGNRIYCCKLNYRKSVVNKLITAP